MGRFFSHPKHGFHIEGEPWARDYYVECMCGWSETGISSHKAAEEAGGMHLYEMRDDNNWLDEDD